MPSTCKQAVHDHIVPLNYIPQEVCGGFVGFGFGEVGFSVINKAFEWLDHFINLRKMFPINFETLYCHCSS